MTFVPRPDASSASKNGPVGPLDTNERRSPILPTLVLLLVVNAATIGTALYSKRLPVKEAEAAAPVEVEAVEEPEENGGGIPQRAVGSPGRRPPPPRTSSPPRQATYRRKGNISDLFCRPVEGESVEQWLARVPAYCLEQ